VAEPLADGLHRHPGVDQFGGVRVPCSRKDRVQTASCVIGQADRLRRVRDAGRRVCCIPATLLWWRSLPGGVGISAAGADRGRSPLLARGRSRCRGCRWSRRGWPPPAGTGRLRKPRLSTAFHG
jgi:hypothetical protein